MAFPLLAAILGGASSLGGALISGRASRRAAEVQGQTAQENRALAEQTTQAGLSDFDKALQDAIAVFTNGTAGATGYQQPFYDTGTASLSALADALGVNGPEGSQRALSAFTGSPGYQFQLQQGVNALDRSANARGNLYSGSQLKSLTEYGQGLANQEWNNYLSQLAGLAGSGQSAAGTLTNLTAANSNNVANTLLGTAGNMASFRLGGLNAITGANQNIGDAAASGIIGPANAWNQGLTNLSTLVGYGAGEGLSMPLLTNLASTGNYPRLAALTGTPTGTAVSPAA